jgi:hypothetical protein
VNRRGALLVLLGIAAAPARAQRKDAAAQKFPDVVGVKVRSRGGDAFDFDVTVSSPYDTPQRYADAFRVTGKDGKVFGERILLHDHADEQPFTRDLHGVRIPAGVRVVVVQARDQKHGYGGKTAEVALPGR